MKLESGSGSNDYAFGTYVCVAGTQKQLISILIAFASEPVLYSPHYMYAIHNLMVESMLIMHHFVGGQGNLKQSSSAK
jgi:hypothetical protein